MSAQSNFRTDEPVAFGRGFVHSPAFQTLYREGMDLVEATAAYLDGPGREQSRELSRHAALMYASHSMRLTTRLMQTAAWLLVQRAVSEGEITPQDALKERSRVRLGTADEAPPGIEVLPSDLVRLIDASLRLHERIVHLDALFENAESRLFSEEPQPSPVAAQQALLRSALGRE